MSAPVRDIARLNVRSADPYFKRTRRPGRRVGPVERVQADPTAWKIALKLAGGDGRRLQLEADGSVFVSNHPRSS